MIKNLKKLEDVALSNFDIKKILDGKVNVVVYPDIHNFKTIDQLMGPNGACALLYESKPKYGHWTAVLKIKNDGCEYFDPYGGDVDGLPDENLKFIPPSFGKKTNQDHTYLINLMVNSPYQLSYNQFKFQKHGPNIRTCGRHVVCRIKFKHLSLEEYYLFLKNMSKELNLDFDEVVTLLTS